MGRADARGVKTGEEKRERERGREMGREREEGGGGGGDKGGKKEIPRYMLYALLSTLYTSASLLESDCAAIAARTLTITPS